MPTVNLDSTSYYPGNLILARFLVMFMPFDFAQESVRQARHEHNRLINMMPFRTELVEVWGISRFPYISFFCFYPVTRAFFAHLTGFRHFHIIALSLCPWNIPPP